MSATTETRSGGNPTPAQSRALERTPRQAFWHGLVQSLPFMLVLVPFGMLFGVVAAEAGLSLVHVLGFSTLVLAGASQFTAVQLMTDQAPVLVVIITAIAVNLRTVPREGISAEVDLPVDVVEQAAADARNGEARPIRCLRAHQRIFSA